MAKLMYPIGKFERPIDITKDIINNWITDISSFPIRLENEVRHLTDEQLDTQYRPEGWTIRQVIHHCADSHMNSLIRLKLSLTEDKPTIKPYNEALWAELEDSKNMPIASSLKIIFGIHERWVNILNKLSEEQFGRLFFHPENNKIYRIDENIGIYAWHSNHHLAHITETKRRMNWI